MSNEVHRDIDAEPGRVWHVLTDLENTPAVLRGVTHVDVLTDGPFRVGTRWRETRRMFGREETQEMEVTGLEALGAVVVEAASGDVTYRTTFTLTALHPGTRLAMRFEAEHDPSGGTLRALLGRVAAMVGDRAVRRVMAADLDDIASAARSR